MADLTNGEIPAPPIAGIFTEPLSNANSDTPPKFPFNRVTQTKSGHSFEMDDTPNGERIRIQHGKVTTFFEMNAAGDMTVKIQRDGYEIIAGNKNVTVGGTCNITVAGDCNLKVNGNMNQQINGDYNLTVKGETNIRSVGELSLSSDDDLSISANENFGGSLRLAASDSLFLDSDLHVGGSITADSLTVESRVNAGMGVFAGPDGFTSALGGLSLGYPTPATPIAVPGSINTIGPITSVVSVNSPFATHLIVNTGILNSVLMRDKINEGIFQTHIHPTFGPGVPTGPTPIPMI